MTTVLPPTEPWDSQVRELIDAHTGGHTIISPDLDGLVSAALLYHHHGIRIAGVYDVQRLILFDGFGARDSFESLWLDLDISRPDIDSIGHHIVHHHAVDELRRRSQLSFNPNALVAQSHADSFKSKQLKLGQRDKYPFGTAHLLLHALQIEPGVPSDPGFHLLAHCDSSWFNAMEYSNNARWWTECYFENGEFFSALVEGLPTITPASDHGRVLERLVEAGVKKGASGRSRISAASDAKWSGFLGTQRVPVVQRNGEVTVDAINNVLGTIEAILGLRCQGRAASGRVAYKGEYCSHYPNRIPAGTFDDWLDENDVFSYAFTSQRELRYTVAFEEVGAA